MIVQAQAGVQGQALLYPPDATAFPKISGLMDVFDGSGRFVSGLKPEHVTIVEDGQPLRPEDLREMVVPLQVTVAINPAPIAGCARAAQFTAADPGDGGRPQRLGQGAPRRYAG